MTKKKKKNICKVCLKKDKLIAFYKKRLGDEVNERNTLRNDMQGLVNYLSLNKAIKKRINKYIKTLDYVNRYKLFYIFNEYNILEKDKTENIEIY